jgi:hypothetical protein
MKHRKWVYVMKPQDYDIFCDKCNGRNIEWSEYEHMIWCYDCKIDTPGFEGIFGGPIPVGACEILGISFARLYFKDKTIRYPVLRGHKIIYTKKRPEETAEYRVVNK